VAIAADLVVRKNALLFSKVEKTQMVRDVIENIF
jgi:hypothetical protein